MTAKCHHLFIFTLTDTQMVQTHIVRNLEVAAEPVVEFYRLVLNSHRLLVFT